MVTVEPGGGLCNRLRTVNSAYFLAKQLNQKLRIVWKLNKELNCAYEKLFKKPKNIEILNYRYSFNGERKKWIRTADTILTQEDTAQKRPVIRKRNRRLSHDKRYLKGRRNPSV